MDIASTPWLKPVMRFGFLALCCLAALPFVALGQGSSLPIVISHPVGVTVYIGDPVTLTAAIGGSGPPTLQWQKNSIAIPGATNSSFSLPSVTLADRALYHLVATNSFGSVSTVPALVDVTKRPQMITFSPTVTTAVAGSSVALAASSTSNLPVTLTLVSGAASLSGNILTGSGGSVVVRATQAGDDTFAPAEAVERTFSFVSGSLSPFITSPPLDQTVTAGGSVSLRATAIGTPAPTYQWQKDGTAISGATASTFTLATTTTADAGRYTIVATNAAGTASASATLTVRSAPTIITAPVSQTIFAGDGTSLSVTATGVPVPTFQWRKNSATLTGATNTTLSFPSAVATDAGRYEVVVTNALGSVTSAPVTLTVNTRDLAGTYFGRFGGTTGDFALLVREDRTAVFLAHFPALQAAVTATNLRIDLTGNFSLNTTTLAATPQAVTLRGAIDSVTGSVSGTLTALGATFESTRAPRTGTAAAVAGLYQLAVVGSAGDRGFMIVAPDGQALVVSSSGNALDSARGNVDAAGRLTATTTSQATVTLTVNNGALAGTVSIAGAGGRSGVIAGMIESRAGAEHLVNLSVRTVTSPGAATLITGFVVTGTTPKQVLIRAAGPALAVAPFNIANSVNDPTLQLFRGNTAIAQNDDWGTPAANTATLTAAATRAGAFPFRAGSQDAALLMTLTPGPYSVIIGGGTGTALAEVYEVLENNEAAGTRRLVNASARGLVTPLAPFIAGFVITGPGPQRVLIRGVGPTLGAPPFNVAGSLPNPELTLFRGSTVVKTNDDWFRDAEATLIRDAAARAGAFALGGNSLDAAILVYLEPGAYTAQVRPAANAVSTTGLALLEIYEARP